MAKFGNNFLTHDLSGKLGDLVVFRQRDGRTILANKPGKRNHEPSAAQAAHQFRFQQAVLYAKSVKNDPEMEAEYAVKAVDGLTVYNVAMADFFLAPHIDEIDVTLYNGQPGSKIKVRAVDDFKVAAVTVSIENTDGVQVEHGAAVREPNNLDWIYTVTGDPGVSSGQKIVICASDMPGNLAKLEREV